MKSIAGVFCIFIGVTASHGANWPEWRGPNGDGTASEASLPSSWSRTENVTWKVALPEAGNSTPVVWGDRVFLTQAVDDGRKRQIICFDRKTGDRRWVKTVGFSGSEATHETNPHCSASPATDGERVVVSFASAGLHCFDMDGGELWHRDFGKQAHIWGNGASPTLHGDLVYLNFGPGERTFLVAVEKRTGKTVWKNDEAGGGFGEKKPGQDTRNLWVGSWSTPIFRRVEGRDELIMSWPRRAVGLNPLTGKEYWECQGLNPLVYTSPIYEAGVVVSMGGYSGSALAVRAGGRGDVTPSRRLWQLPKTPQRIGSGVFHEGHVYIVNDRGTAHCINAENGSTVWEERLKGPGKNSRNWSSLVLNNGMLHAVNWSGDAFAFPASPKFHAPTVNSIGEKTIASIAVSDGQIFIRSHENLWCIGARR
ncbi:MAG: PQQ-binding-like beta-propeller repeat protein [Verrucomicrobiae bacterium]|nr:PQQ-binding-like beta-propeller repeat protein [Verrucomicrobiae bacterium]